MDRTRFNQLFLEELFGATTKSQISQCPQELWIVIEEIQALGVKTVVEIGVSNGGSSKVWTEVVGPDGLVVGVDSGGDPKRALGDPLPNNYKHVTENSQLPETVEKVKKFLPDPIDFLFIDGDHQYEGVKKDIELYFPLVKVGGIIALQDTNYAKAHNDHVWKAWHEIDLPNKTLYDYGMGTGIIRL